jgi:hypothetical protein
MLQRENTNSFTNNVIKNITINKLTNVNNSFREAPVKEQINCTPVARFDDICSVINVGITDNANKSEKEKEKKLRRKKRLFF